MEKSEQAKSISVASPLTVPAFGYELIREELISDLLGKDRPAILYWAGKRLARNYPLFSLDEMKEFFLNAGWGELQLVKEGKREAEFELTGELIRNRIQRTTNLTFQLEAGFLAEQIQQQKKVFAEALETLKKDEGKVRFLVQWDTAPFD
ncbi:YslB family protein [Caldibacillus debilis]|uniref:DUF2507 domain-containing protein n=2 Tax=Caldibacillus debilis TaxID=301148 RepID=A0A420VIK1_9BACI|nr:YslB family protein [Caldibacillus debilis]KYD11651.1 hypothetical protein B4135_3203 [Caldibacillus debilis]OUM83594.1 MAG: hypothetical protein BAA03_07650 [Caldibacillus debilis]RKO63511.1 Protein of unknown function (DUF2507) [Caldibacillus debilis GB1]